MEQMLWWIHHVVVETSCLMVYPTGGIFYSTLLGQNLVVISDEKIAYELLERRSAIYSDRPYLSTNEL